MELRWLCFSLLVGCLLIVGCLLNGCGSTQAAPPTPLQNEAQGPAPSVAATPTPEAAGGPVIPRCGATEGTELTSFSALRPADGTLHHAVVSHAGGAWSPVENIEMPMHHATALHWTNLADFQTLDEARSEQLRFVFTVLSRRREHRSDENVFLTTYNARVEVLCSTSAPADRPEGALLASVSLDTTSCPGLEAAAGRAARALGECTSDAQCTIVQVDMCEIEGLGCYWVAANQERETSDLLAALLGLSNQPCPISSCDCPAPPTAARCRDAQCVGL